MEAGSINSRLSDSSETLVCVDNISKKFCRNLKRSLFYGVKDMANGLNPLNRQSASHMTDRIDNRVELRRDEFWAVRNVGFNVARGECLGLIGRNGAGKTTLLRMLAGLIQPDSGCITVRGRVGALIALGIGFNPVLTGLENIAINGVILGLTRSEVKRKTEEIIDFAGLEEFMDAPVSSYSSGMKVRLGFSIASCVDPDVLLLDEVLAVGDMDFKAKCYGRIGELKRQGTALILVSHQLQDIRRHCHQVICMEKGQIQVNGTADKAIQSYLGSTNEMVFDESSGTGEHDLWIIDATCDNTEQLLFKIRIGNRSNNTQRFILNYSVHEDLPQLICRVVEKDSEGQFLAVRPNGFVEIQVGLQQCYPGQRPWEFRCSLWDENHRTMYDWRRGISIPVKNDGTSLGRLSLNENILVSTRNS